MLHFVTTQIERLVEASSNLAIKEWRRLPNVVGNVHVGLLQVSHTYLLTDYFFFLMCIT